VIMDHGRVRQIGTPAEVYDDPADTFVATFLGSPPMNLLERDGVILGFRPEHVRAADGPAPAGAARFRFRCELTEYLGSERLAFGAFEGDWGGREVVWRFPSWEPGPAVGSVQDVVVEKARLRFFDPATGRRTAERPAP
jgi:multiple sugar transport system ATP-binding protein